MTYSNADFTPGMKGYSDIKPFRFWCQKVLPLVYDDSLSYYELLCKVTDYINNIITDLATTEENVGSLLDAYNQLQGYVNNYFTNLNVQEEINNKLDSLVEDGTLTELIGNYIDPRIAEIQEELDDYETEMTTNFNGLQSATESNLQQQNDKIFVLEGRMDTFTQLTPGSTTGDAELQDIRVAYNGTVYPTAGDAVRGQVGDLNNELNHYTDSILLNAIDPNELENGYYGASGELLSNDNFSRSQTYYPCKGGQSYKLTYTTNTISYFGNAAGGLCFYDSAKNFITRFYNQSVYEAPSNASYLRYYISKVENSIMMLSEGSELPTFYVPKGYEYKTSYQNKREEYINNSFENNIVKILGGTKTWTIQTLTNVSDKYINQVGTEIVNTLWKYGYIDCKPNVYYKTQARGATACYRVMVLDDYGKLIKHFPNVAADGYAEDVFLTPYNASKIIINGNASDSISLSELTNIDFKDKSNVLNEKKLYCGGDSITEAVNVGSFPNGYKKSYSGHVAVRNNMVYVSDGIGGSCMGNVMVDGWNYNAFCVNRYLNIPTDSDYITLWFGWNDNAYGWKSMRDAYCVDTYGSYYSQLTDTQKTQVDSYKTWTEWLTDYVGTVESTSDKTWCGAWSKVLTWLLNNCPNARIGVVIAYGMYTELSDALIAICEKYGVAYIKAYDAHEFFSVGYSENIGTVQADKRKTLYTLDGTHPNELGYEMMSTSYEQFLRKI